MYQNATDFDLVDQETLLVPMIYVVCLIIIGVPGNILVLLVYGIRMTRTTSVNKIIILTLAINDLLVSAITLPFEFYDQYNYFSFTSTWSCKIFRTLNYIFVFNSAAAIHLMTIERFRRVCRPLKRQMSPKVVLKLILGFCPLSIIITSPNMYFRGIQKLYLDNNATGHHCAISDHFKYNKLLIGYNGAVLITCVCSILLIMILYMFIGRQVYKHLSFVKRQQLNNYNKVSSENTNVSTIYVTKSANELCGTATDGPRNRNMSDNYKTTKIAVLISIFFIVSYVPTLIEILVEDMYGEQFVAQFISLPVRNIIQKTFAINHVINPFIYGFIDKKFREDCVKIGRLIVQKIK